MIGLAFSNSTSTPAARAWSTSLSLNRIARRAVRVAVKLLVQRGGFVEQCLGLLPEPQIGDLVAVELGQMGGEHLARAAAKRGVDHPPRLAGEALGRPLVAVAQVGDHGFEQLRADLADAAQLLDGGERDHALAGQLLRLLGELEQLHARGDALLGPAERLRGAVLASARGRASP